MTEHESIANTTFLGSKAENRDVLERMILEVLRDHAYWRRACHPEDPILVTPEVKTNPSYVSRVATLETELWKIISKLKRSVPFFSTRYVGHMASETTLPALVGYFAGMLYNPNNVTTQAAPYTSELEMSVGKDLARMVGYRGNPWGHLTSGGTVANAEGFWVARNLRYQALAVAAMLRDPENAGRLICPALESPAWAMGKQLVDLSVWELFNFPLRQSVLLRDRISLLTRQARGLPRDTDPEVRKEFDNALQGYTLAELGWAEFSRKTKRIMGELPPEGVVLISKAMHYSWKKIADILGLGRHCLRPVSLDRHFRMEVDEIRAMLEGYLDDAQVHAKQASDDNGSRPLTGVLAVVPVCGTTEEGAVDEIAKIVELRDAFEPRGLCFYIHADAAYGGYLASMVRKPDGEAVTPSELIERYKECVPPKLAANLHALSSVDSITIDPHKLGYVPYPAGAVLFKDKDMRRLISCFAPYVFKEGQAQDTFIGPFILEGSKPGATAVACSLSHQMLPLDWDNHGRLLAGTLRAANILYGCLNEQSESLEFRIVPLCEPDTNVVCYVVRPTDLYSLLHLNLFNQALADRMGVGSSYDVQWNYLISSTELGGDEYRDSLRDFFGRLDLDIGYLLSSKDGEGLKDHRCDTKMVVLRSAMMNPFVAESPRIQEGFDDLVDELFRHAGQVKDEVRRKFDAGAITRCSP